jgi:RNA polymerase sigma-70 factor (ECF subfamily)
MLATRAVRGTVAGARATDVGSDAERADAFRLLTDGHLDDSYRLANAILGNPTEARDAVHDAIITGWQRWSSLRDPDKFDSWFKRIVVNTCKNTLQQAARRRTTDISVQPKLATPDASQAVHDKIQIEQGLARLKPDDRIVLALRYYHDLKLRDIANVLDIPTGTAKSRLNHAHARLRAVLDRSSSEEHPR